MEKQQIEIRNLEARDVFPFSKIISKIGFNELKNCFTTPQIKEIVKGKKQSNDLLIEVGAVIAFELLGVVLSNLDKVENDLYKLFASLTGKTEKEISELPPADFADLLIRLFQKEEFGDFFKVVSKLLVKK